MDVPSWHPANDDASRSRTEAVKPQRTEFKVMPGSTADLSTEAGRELLSEVTDGGSAAVEGRGFFDSSDRLYLQEQRRLEQERHQQTRAHDQAELLKFRSTALKVQAQKAAVFVDLDATIDATKKKATASTPAPLVVIKTKKRSAPTTTEPAAKQQRKASDSAPPATSAATTTTAAARTRRAAPAPAPAPPATSLLLGYSSDSSDSDT